MKLKIKNRLLLLNILPVENNILNLKIIKNLQEQLSFSEEEIKQANIKQIDGRAFWDEEKDFEKEIEIGEIATNIIIQSLKTLNSHNKLHIDYIELYEMFVKE